MAERGGASPDWRRPTLDPLSPVLASALAAFYDNGYHGSSVRDIARGAGMTVPGLYYHFESKQDMLFALLDQSISAVIDVSKAATLAGGDDPVARFDNLVEALVRYVAEHPRNALLDAEIRALTPENRRRYSAQRRVIERMLVRAIDDARRVNAFAVEHPADTARALLGMIQSIATWYQPGGRLSVTALAKRYLDVARHGVGAPVR